MIIKPEIFSNDSINSMQTTRMDGISQKPYNSLNLGVFGNDDMAQLNVNKLYEQYNLPHKPLFMNQSHSDNVIQYKSIPSINRLENTDACYTNEKNIICAILTADCLPILIADKQATVVAAIHCGWRGLYSNILKKTITKLNVNPKNLECWLGPCISYKPYRVDEKFRKKFVLKDKQYVHSFYRSQKGTWHADLKKIAVCQLESLGINSISQSPYCTHGNKNMFYSYRRDGETGRMASLIWLD